MKNQKERSELRLQLRREREQHSDSVRHLKLQHQKEIMNLTARETELNALLAAEVAGNQRLQKELLALRKHESF